MSTTWYLVSGSNITEVTNPRPGVDAADRNKIFVTVSGYAKPIPVDKLNGILFVTREEAETERNRNVTVLLESMKETAEEAMNDLYAMWARCRALAPTNAEPFSIGIVDVHGVKWNMMFRPGGSVCLYTTVAPDRDTHTIHWDSVDDISKEETR